MIIYYLKKLNISYNSFIYNGFKMIKMYKFVHIQIILIIFADIKSQVNLTSFIF